MEVETRYTIGDFIWMVYNNKVCEFVIDGVFVDAGRDKNISIKYSLCNHSNERYDENQLYDSKEELLKSL